MNLTTSERVRLIEDHYASFWSGNLDDFDHQLAPAFVDAGAPAGTEPGPGPVKEYAARARQAFPDMVVSVDDAVVESSVVATVATWRGTHLGDFGGVGATGREVSFRGLVVWEFDDDGRIVRRSPFFDPAAILGTKGAGR